MSTASKKKISKKLVFKILASVVIIGGISAYYLISRNKEGEVLSWMSSSWAYRKGVEVDNAGGTQLTNEDVLITLDTASLVTGGKMQNDCDDLRVTDSDTTTSINYWIESGCDTSSTRIWVRIPTLPAAGTTIYLYYGNTSASNAEKRWPIYLSFGDGADGDVTISANTNINTGTKISGRSCADGGDAVNYNVTAFGGTTATTATLSATPSSGCLSAGDEVLLINLQGTSSAYTNVGNHEIMVIDSISTNTVTFTTLKTKYYGSGSSNDSGIGTTTSTQRVMLQRIPNYNDVTIDSGYSFYPSAWNGTKGGVMMFKANGTVTVTGTIHANALGYRGGSAAQFYPGGGGETYGGYNSGTGGDEDLHSGYSDPGDAGNMGGGGGGASVTDGGSSSGGSGTTTGGAGGGGGCGKGQYYYQSIAGAGGGGGYGTAATGGAGYATGTSGGTETSGAGGGGRSSKGGGGGGGGTYGSTDLTKIYFGSAGGGGGTGYPRAGGAGGIAGGIVLIKSNSISVNASTGAISSTGGVGNNAPDYGSWTCGNEGAGGGGGGGAGGSIKILADTATLNTTRVTALGNSGGYGICYNGGTGGNGRIAVEYITSSSGTTSPSASTTQKSTQSVTIQTEETYNQAPTAPTNLYTEGSTNPTKVTDLTPEFSAIFNDPDTGDTSSYYQIQVNTNSSFTGTEMWNSTKTSMTSTSNGSRSSDLSYAGTSLSSNGTTYYWKVKFWDNSDAEGAWSDTANFTMSGPPSASSLLVENTTNPIILNSASPVFSAICTDPNGDNCSAYEIDVDTVNTFDGTELWNTGKTSTTITSGSRSSDIIYHGTPLTNSENIYYWRIRFWDTDDNAGEWSSTAQFTDFYPSFRFEGLGLEGIQIN